MKMRHGVSYSFYGMKKADGMNRRLMLNRYEDYEYKGKVYPLSDWSQKDIDAYIRQHGLPEPVRYSKNASQGVGLNIDCFLWMRENYPQDLEKVLKVFPLSERILFEHDKRYEGTK
jgi:sulfate adenylyltransferase subunit 2